MKKVLITGANKSIGFETARQLLQQGYYVYLGCRDLEKGKEAVAQLHSEGLTQVMPISIDVTDAASILAASQEIGTQAGGLDILINNAGISGGFPQTAIDTPVETIETVFDTNLFGVVRVTQAFLDLLRKSGEPRIVNVTSGLGSITLNSDPDYKYNFAKGAAYNTSKAALNMYSVILAYELKDTPFKVNVVDPGYTSTDFNHHSGPGTIPDAAARVAKAAMIPQDGPTGQFFSDDNAPETGISPW